MNVLRALALFAILGACASSAAPAPASSSPRAASPSGSGVPSTLQTKYAAAQAATTLFHVRFDQRNFSRMYAATDASFRKEISEPAFTSNMSALRARVGASVNEDETDADAYAEGTDAIVTIWMETEFQNTVLSETFVWRVTQNEMTLLVSYEAN